MIPELSIIIPVYNTAQYLQECLNSCLAQSFTDWECLLVDDGSTDNSIVICEAYAKEDKRFHLLRNHHAGVAAARNAGMHVARGKWIGFADSDDRFLPGMFDRMIHAQRKSNADVVICSFQAFESPDRSVFYPDFHTSTPEKRVFGVDEASMLFLCDAAPWNKLFLREFLDKNALSFPQGLQYEDILFWNYLVRVQPSFYYLPEKLYEYRQNRNGSTITSHTVDDLALSFFVTMKTIETLDRPDMMRDFGKRFPLRAIKAAVTISRVKRKQFVHRCQAIFRHVYRKNKKAVSTVLFIWATSPEWLLRLLINLCFLLRLRLFTQFLKKCDSFFSYKTKCML